MDIHYDEKELAFREEVRQFIREKLPPELAAKVKSGKRLTKEDFLCWQNILSERGWLAQHWPKEYGGPGWGPVQRHIYEEEAAAAGAPWIIPFGVGMVGPVIIKFGTKAQKEKYLPRILRNEDWWCQGYSEPGAGSDLASLKTRAERHGDHYIVNGQKTWTTYAHYADMMFCLVRTDPKAKPQEGISFLLIDMKSPGVTVRPLLLLDGEHEVNEVFLENVKVPFENLVGEENKGWTCAKYLLGFERTGIAGVGQAKEWLRQLKAIAAREKNNGKPLIEDPSFRARVAAVEVELMALEMTNLRVVADAEKGGAPGPESSMLKILGSELRQEITDLMRRAVGPYALPFFPEYFDTDQPIDVGPEYAPPLAAQYFNHRKVSIYGGSNEIQRNIIAKMILGL
ncbi:acyl-CoA dehydrogenase family protein [Tepidiphilus olei]|uniref:acyl-CoA dehydrogenase family protein n=1 Tax=Tepidiphilus olei TaxID=2502184 RepID=UPI00115C9346|nr:acyl-CoA dehydrogenase family protein [Tepidiphilus olei]